MSTTTLSTELAEFGPGDLSARAVSGLLGVLPFAASWSPTFSLRDAAAALDPVLADRIVARAEARAAGDGPRAALAAFTFLDKGDSGIALFSGLRGAYKVVRGQDGALELDPQQAADAGLKAIGIAWAAWKLFDGTAADRARALAGTEAGRALLTWYIAADLVLPFTDNLAAGGASAITGFIDAGAAENAARLAAVAGPEVEQATGVLKSLLSTVETTLDQAAAYAAPLSQYVQQHLPGVLASADSVTGVVATAVDTLACYRLVGGSLVAEVCLARAATEVQAEAAAEAKAAEEARLAAEKAAEIARLEAEAALAARRRVEEEARVAEAHRRIEEEKARRDATRQREDYSLDEAVEAASLRANPVKVTRGGDLQPAKVAPAARSGCMGCGSVFLAVLVVGGVAALLV